MITRTLDLTPLQQATLEVALMHEMAHIEDCMGALFAAPAHRPGFNHLAPILREIHELRVRLKPLNK